LRSFECSADFEIDGGISRLLRRLEIRPDRLKKLRANFFIDGQPRIQMEFATETHRAGSGEMNIRRAQDQFVNRHHARGEMVFRLGLIKMQLSEFFDLEKLTERDQQIVLPELTVM